MFLITRSVFKIGSERIPTKRATKNTGSLQRSLVRDEAELIIPEIFTKLNVFPCNSSVKHIASH